MGLQNGEAQLGSDSEGNLQLLIVRAISSCNVHDLGRRLVGAVLCCSRSGQGAVAEAAAVLVCLPLSCPVLTAVSNSYQRRRLSCWSPTYLIVIVKSIYNDKSINRQYLFFFARRR